MVRETRHLWVGNLPETVREDRIREHFKRSSDDHSPSGFDRNNFYERNTARSSVSGDQEQYIRRPNNYHHSGDVRGRTRDRLYRNGPYSASIVDRTNQVGHHRVTPSSTWYDSGTSSTTTSSRNVYGNVASAVVTPDSGYDVGLERRNSNNDDILTIKKSSNKRINKKILLRSGSESPPSCGGESGDSSRSHSRSPSSCSSTNSTTSNSNESGSPNSGTDPPSRSRNIQSAVSAPTPNTSNPNPVVHSEDNRPLAICVRNLPARSSDTSLKDGLFHEYKKHGKVTWVKVVGQSTDRYALVCFKKPDDVEKALEVSHDKLFFGCKIEVEPYQGYDVDDNEFRPYEAELDEYHPKSTRTLFIGNLEKDITANDLRKHFECFGEIIEIDIKKQGVTAYAFCQYSDIISVVKAMRKMDGEHLGNNRIKLGFGKSMPTNCVWIDGISDSVSENYLTTQFNRFGPVSQVAIDRDRKLALVFFEQIQYAQTAVKEMRGITLRGRKLQVDFASRECQEAFYEKLDKPLERDRSLGFETVREVSTRGFETTVSVPGARYSRYDTPSRSRTSSFSRHSNISSSGAASPSNSGGNTPRGPSRTSRVVRYPADYYDNVGLEFPATDGRRFKSYDEYSQGSGASHDEIYDHEAAAVVPSATVYHKDRLVESPPPLVVGQVPIAINPLSASNRLSIVEPEILNATPTTPTTMLAAGPTPLSAVPLRRRTEKSPGDIRHLQKERSHLLEQLEECPSSSSDEQLFSPKKRIKFDNPNQTITGPPLLLQSSRGAIVGGDCVNNSVSSGMQQSTNIGNVIDTINVQNNSVVNQLSLSNSNNNSDSICDSSSSSNLLLLTQLSIDHIHRKSVEIRRLSECSSGQKFLSSNTNSNTINSSNTNSNINSNNNNNNNSRRPSTDNLLLSRRCDDHSLLNVYPSSHHNMCKRRKTSIVSETEYHHSSRGRGHQLHSHHSHEASGGESADGSRPGTPLCDERPENITLIIPTEPRRIPTARDRIPNIEPLSLPLPKFALQMFQNRLYTGSILSSGSSTSSLLVSVSSTGAGIAGGGGGNGGIVGAPSSAHHSSASSSSSSSLQHSNHQASLNSLTLSSPPPHHHHHHHPHHHHHHHHHLSNNSSSNNQSSPKVLPPLNITQLNSNVSTVGGGVSSGLGSGIEQPPSSPSRAPSLSSNSSDSEMAPTGSPSLEERIKTLDEMFERWAGNNTNRGSSLTNVNNVLQGSSSSLSSSSHPEPNSATSSLYLRHKFFDLENEQPSDILKSVLAKKSIFDDDLKRLENIGDKYEPREFTSFSRSVTNLTSSIASGGCVVSIGVSSSLITTSTPTPTSVGMNTKPPITTTTASSINQTHLPQRLVGGHHTTTSSPMNSPQPISPYNSPSPSPNVVNSTIKNCVVIPKGLQYPFPSHPPNNSSSTIISSSSIITTTTLSNVTTVTTSNVASSPKQLNRSMPITKSVSLTEKSSSLTNISSNTRILNKSTSVPGSTNTGTIKIPTTTASSSSSSLKDDNGENENICSNKSRRSSVDLSTGGTTQTISKSAPIATQSTSSSNSSSSSLCSSSSAKQSANNQIKKDDKTLPSNNSCSINKSRECLDRRKTFDEELPPNPENINENEVVKVDKEKPKKSKEELPQMQQTQRNNSSSSSNYSAKEKEQITKEKEVKEEPTEKEKEKEVIKIENEKIDEKSKENYYVNDEFSQLKRRERNSSSSGSISGSGTIGSKRRISDTNEADELKRIRMNNEHRKVVDRRDSRDQQKSHHKQHKSSSSSTLHKQSCNPSNKSKENENLQVNSVNNQQSNLLLSTFDLIRKEVVEDKQPQQSLKLSIDDQNKSIHNKQKRKESEFDQFDSVHFLENLDARSSEDDQALLAQHQQNKEKRKEHKKKQREMEQRDDTNIMGSSPLTEQTEERRRSDSCSTNKNIENRKSSSSSSGSSSHRNNNNNEDHHSKSGSDRKSGSSHRSQERLQHQQQKIHRLLNSSDDSDSDSLTKHNRQHSIFDIPDEGPTYISMYDKVKARSCKNMQKQEEEKKIKAKFNQLKQSRAKREEKKRSTSWDEDSDSDFDHERRIRRHNHKSNKSSFIASSSDEDNERRHLHVQLDFNTSDSEADQLARLQYKHEHDCGDTSDSSMIQHAKPRRKITSRKSSRSQGRIHFDTSDDEYHSGNQKPSNHIKSESDESKEMTSVTDVPSETQSSNKQHNDISVKTENDMPQSDVDMVQLKSIKLEPGLKSNNSSDDENKIVNPSATIKQESKENLSDIGMSGGDNNTMSVKDKFDQLFSPETRRKHKKKQKRQKSLPPAIEIKIEKQDESSNHKLETQSPPLSGNSIDFNKTEQQQVSLIEKTKKHSSKKEKRREKEYDSSSKERSKDERKMKKSKKPKSSDGYSFEQHNEMSGNTISISSTNKRGEKMEDIFGPITDEDSDHSTEVSNTNDAPNKPTAQENAKQCETFEEDKNNENESGISKGQPSDVTENEFKAPPIEQPNIPAEKERHREESRKRKEKKRKEKEKLRAAMLHTEDDNSVDLDEAGRALEAQLMEDCDSKSYDAVLTENQKSSENKTSNVEVTSDLFRYSGENDENSEVLNISDSKHDNTMQDGHRIKEKKKKKKRSKEEKHQKREHHHHHSSSSSISSSTPIKKEPPLPIKIPDTNVELSGGNLNKQSPSLPCLIEDSPPRSNITSTSDHPVTSASPTKLHVENKRSKHESNFIPGFGGIGDNKIHESAVESLSKELENAEKLSKIEVDEPSPMLSLPPAALKTSKSEEKTEEKSRVVISQEETEDAVAALLGESFGTSNAEDYNDCYGTEPENLESSPPNPVETVIPEEDAEEMRKALESLNAEELDIKPDTPQSENDLRIDTDTEDQEEESVNQFKFNNPPKTPDVDLTQILRTVIEKQSTGPPLVPTAQKELEVKQQIITITSTASVVKSDSVVTSTASVVSSAPSLPRSESSIVTTQPSLNTTIVTQKVVQPVRSSSITITKSSLSKPSISPTRLSTIRPQQFTIAGGTQPQTIQQHISRTNTQFIMQPPTISIPEQQHIIYSPLGVMVSPRPAEPTHVHSPRTQVPQQPQFQCPEAIKRTNSPQSPNIIRSQNPRMSPQLSPVMSPHSVVVQQRLSSPSTHQSVMTTGGSTQSQQQCAQQQQPQPNSGQTNILINRVPVTPILTPIAQKTAGGTNIVLQQGSNQPQKTVNVVLSQNQKLTPPVSMNDAIMSKVQPTMPQPTVVTYSTTVRVVPVTTPSQQMQGQQSQQAQQQPKTLITTLPQNTIINQQINKQASKMIESKMNVSNTQSPQQQVVTSQNSQIMFQQQKQLQQHQMFQHQKILQQHNFANQQHAILKQQQQQIHQQQQQMQQQKIVISTKPTVQQPAQSQNIMLLPQSKLQPVQTSLHVHQPQSLEKVQQPALPQTMQPHVAQPKELSEPHNNRQHSSIIVCQNISKPQTPQILQAPAVPAIITSVQSPKAQSPQIAQPPQNSESLPIVKAPLPPQQQSQPPQPTHQPPAQPPPPPSEPVPDQKEVTKPIIPVNVEKPSEVEEIVGEIELGKKDCPIVPSEKVASEKPVEQSQPQVMEKPQEQAAQLQPTNVPKSLLTEENLTKLTNSQEDVVEQDSKEDSDYWSAKEVNIESVIKKVDALCSGEDTSEESSEIIKEEWNEEKSLKPQKPLELPQVIGEPSKEENQPPPAPVTPSPAQEEKQTTSPVIEQSVSNTHEDDDFDEGVGEHIDKDMDKTVQRKGGRSARGKKDTLRTNHNNNNKIVIQTSQPQEPYIVQHSQQSSTSTTPIGGVQTRRGGKATSARRGRGGKQSGRHSISNATSDDRKARNTNSESDVYEFNEDSGEEVRPRLILTIKSPNIIVSNHAGVTPQVTLSVSQPQSTTQSITIPTTTTANTTVQKPTVSTQPAIVVPSSLPPNMHDNKEDFPSPALNTRKSRRLQERDGSRNTIDDVIEDVVRNLSTSPKGPQTGNSPPASLTPPRRSTRQTATIKPPPAVPIQSDKLSVVNVVAVGDIRKSPRANRVKGKDRKTSETSTDSSDEKPRSEDKSMPDLSTDVVKTTTDVTPTVENVVEETKAIPNETNESITIKVVPVLPPHSVQKTPEPSEPTTLIDPVTGELMVMRQSKEGQYIPVPGAPPPKVPTPPEVIKAPSSVAESNPTAHNKPVPVPVTSQSLIVSPVSNIQKQQSQSTVQVVLQPPGPPTPKQTPIIVSTASQSNMSPVIMTTSVSSSPKVQQSTSQLQPMQLPQQQQAQYPQVPHNLPPKVSTPTQQTHQTTPAVVNNPSQIIQQTQPLPQQQQPQTKPMTLKSHVLNSTQLHKVTNPQMSQQQQTLPTIVPQTLPNLSNHIQPQQKITKLNVSGMPPMPTQGQPLAQQQSQPNTIVINSNAVNMKSLQQSGLSALSNQQQLQQQIALQQQQLQHHSHIQMPQKPQITQNIPHNLLVNVNHPMNSAISQATLSPRMKLQPQQQSPQPQSTQQTVPGQSQSIPQHIHKISMPQPGHPTHIQQQQLPPQQSSQPQLVIHSSGKISSPQSIYSPAKIVHPGQTIQISARNPPEQIIIKQPPPSSSQQHQIVKQALPSGSIHHVQQQQQQGAQSSTISAHMHSSTKVVQQPIHLQNQSPVHHIITTPAPAHHQPPPQAQQTTSSTNLHSVKPAHQQQITTAAPPPTKQLLGRHQTPQILTGSVASPPLKQQHHHSVVTVSNRATIPPISPQEQSRVHALQSGLPNPAYEASLADVNYSPIRTVPREHLMMYQYYKAQEMGHGARVPYIPRSPMLPGTGEKPDMPDMDETITGTSPPLELRRPTSGPRTTVPHSLQSPQDRATDSPQVAQVYVHGARIPHPHFPDANARFHEVPSRAILAEPPPAHHHQSQHQRNVVPSYTAQQTPPTNLTSHIHPQVAPQIATPIIDKEREQREREQQRRERERTSIPGYTNVPSHVPAPTTGRNLQVATPPHASQVPPQGDSLLMLLQRYPVMWQGLLALKNDQAAVQMHFVFGNPQVATDSLPCNSDGSTPPLRIAQRMRLEQSQLDGVSKKMQTDNEHCMLLALPCGRDHMDVLQQSKNLQSGFITYLQQKQAAGIVNIAAPGSQQAAYVVHIFPSCEFANENLARIAPDLLHRVAEIAHLLIIIATV